MKAQDEFLQQNSVEGRWKWMEQRFDIALSFAMENQSLVGQVYHYLKAEKFSVFFAPSPEGQVLLSGKNQREIFYQIFGGQARYVALFVSKDYVVKEVPMEEAYISIKKHSGDGRVIPIYLDDTELPLELLDPKQVNYYRSHTAADIATHLAAKLKMDSFISSASAYQYPEMHISNNQACKQIFIQNMNGTIDL